MKRKAIFLGLAVVLLAAAAFFLLYPRTTGPVLRLQEDTRIQSVILRENGTEQIWTPVTEADREKERAILDMLAASRQRPLLPHHQFTWQGDASTRQHMRIVVQDGSRLTNIDLADDDIVGEGPFNMVFASGRLLDSRGYLLTPGEIRACVDTTLAETDYTARPAA
ncbi:MAG: hypothetical protein MR286_10705 [Clostridiales bacterium]|nr:hypothetical protein [Clostridiales bacterium]